jgi:2-polyprenyl-3-methyl-5-hydroxy-6-metoxy-1,4-benzoquinol methylase
MTMEARHEAEYEALNRIAATYDVHDFDRRMRHYMMRALAPYLVAGKALELGCFLGEFTELLAQRFADLTVVDAAREFIDHARRRVGERVRFVNALFETFSTDDRFSSIFLMHTLEHLDDPVGVLARARALLAPGGRVFAVVPNAQAASRQIAVKMGVLPHLAALSEADVKHGHRRVYGFDTLESHLREAGLDVVHRGGVFFKALANFQFEKALAGGIVSEEYMEGCYRLGMEYPSLCASIVLVGEARPAAA